MESQPIIFLGVEDQSIKDENQRKMKFMDSSGNLDHDLVEKIRELKNEYENKIKDSLREKAMQEVKVDAMAKKIIELE